MSESIDNINVNSAATKFDAVKKDKITEETKKRLEELGIDSSSIKTETEAQQKIKEAESVQANAQILQPQNVSFSHPMGEVMKDAKELAEKLGLRVANIDDVEKLLEVIDKQIKEFEKQVENDITNERKDMVSGARNKYLEIKNEFDQSLAEQKKITNNLDMIATYNMVRS